MVLGMRIATTVLLVVLLPVVGWQLRSLVKEFVEDIKKEMEN